MEIARASEEQFIGCWTYEGGTKGDQNYTLHRLETGDCLSGDAEVANRCNGLVGGLIYWRL